MNPGERHSFPDYPHELVRNLVGIHGSAAIDWLRALPGLCADMADRWDIALSSEPVGPLSYNFVVGGTRRADGLPVVLKIGLPGPALTTEAAALRVFDGNGAARLLAADTDRGALLIERVLPGRSLTVIADEEDAATRAAARVMRALWRPVASLDSSPFPHVAVWARGLSRHRARHGGGSGPLPSGLFARAEALFAVLLASSPEVPMLLHGDLHHGNILDAGAGRFTAIDPNGILGDPAFEPSAFLLNPGPRETAVLARRLDVFAEELGLDRERMRGWGLARAVLSACWTIEDNGDGWEAAIAVGERLVEG